MNIQRFDNEKFKELMLYIADRNKDNPRFGAVVLNKMLYYSDFFWYALTGQSITGDTYIRKDRGNVPKHLLPMREALIKDGKLKKEQVKAFGLEQTRITPIEEFKKVHLSDDQLRFVDLIIGQIQPMTGQQVSQVNHRELSWNILSTNDEVPYFMIFLRSINPIPKDTMSWAKELIKKRRIAAVA